MATAKASVKATGGGGFLFADQVAAQFFAHLLTGGLPLGPEYGTISKIEFENRERGWLTDDLLLTLDDGKRFCAISLKSNDQVTQNGFPEDFVRDAWEQSLRSALPFKEDRDILALGTARVAGGVRAAWDSLLKQAIETGPERMVLRLMEEGQSSALQRQLFLSLHCPADLDTQNPSETARLLRSLRLLVWDFEAEPSNDESAAIALCRSALRSGDIESAISLWKRLQGIAEEARTTGASIQLRSLLEKLRGQFELKNHPDFDSDWQNLHSFAAESRAAVRQEIGPGIRIARTIVEQELREKMPLQLATVLRGESGRGKSALVANVVVSAHEPGSIVWLDRTQFNHPNQTALANALTLRHTIPELLPNSSQRAGYLVLDSLERFSAQGIRRAAELIKAASALPGQPWRVLITCQAYSWNQVVRELFRAGIKPGELSLHDIGPPDLPDLLSAVRPVAPGVATLLMRPELRGVLSNLKVLDWVLIEEAIRADTGKQPFVGESDIIEWIWERHVGESPAKHARAGLLIEVAEHEGESLGSYIKIGDLGDDKRRTAGDLEQDRLLRVHHGNITFSHDLLGDWARYQSLRNAGPEVTAKIKEVVTFPRWQQAVRLYGQYLLEHENGAERWKEMLASFQGESSESFLAGDCFLDALIFASSGEALLEQVWPHLVAEKGQLLHRFIKRFLYVATAPDPRVREFASTEDIDWFLSRMRIPYVWHWYAPLRVFGRHGDDLCRLALILASEFCELWLRTIPTAWGGRQEAAKLALTLAREAQGRRAEHGRYEDDSTQKVYEALLHAAPDLPEEVSQVALELCERREPSPEIAARVNAYQERRRAAAAERLRNTPPEELARRRGMEPPVSPGRDRGPLRPADPNGPARRVSEAFQLAVLNTSALMALAQIRPTLAREVLLAVCIDEPKSERHGGAMLINNDFGTTDWPGGYPPMYFRGPFLRFLQTAPGEAIKTITQLVNYATERWAETFLRGAPKNLNPNYHSLEMNLPQGTVRWAGNINVFVWFRDIMVGSNSVVSALMALEKWLYDELDAGRSIDKWINQILQRSSSLAFAGLLVAVGLKNPALLAGPLRFLLATWPIYDWQLEQTLQEDSWKISLMSWSRSGEQIFNQVVQWHSLSHRKKLLRDTATELFVGDKKTREFLSARREFWVKELEEHPNEDLELIAARFDAKNYRGAALENGRVMIEFEWPEHLREQTTAKAEAAQEGSLAIAFPHRCRRILTGEETVTADEFWAHFQSLASWKELDENGQKTIRRSTITAAGIAVVVTVHRAWLRGHPEHETWCFEQLRSLAAEDFTTEYSPHAIMEAPTESFISEAALALIPERNDAWVREVAAGGVMGFYYSSTAAVMKQAFRLRNTLGEDFGRTVNLMICWAAIRRVHGHRERAGETPSGTPDRALRRILKAYVEKHLPAHLLPIERVADIVRRAIERIDAKDTSWRGEHRRRLRERGHDRNVYRNDFFLDTEVLSRGFSFLGSLPQAGDETDRAEVIRYHRAVLDVFLQTMPKLETANEEVEGTPYEFDRWVLGLTAALIPQLPSAEEARSFWNPIMDLGPGARYWIQDFFRHWFMAGRQASPSLEVFAEHWKEMIAYSLDSPAWTPKGSHRSYLLEECSCEVMGIEFAGDITSKEEFTPIIAGLAPLFKRWAQRWLAMPRSAAQFAYFLVRPAGRALLPSAIIWLNEAVQKYSGYEWRERELDDTLTGALRACWKHASSEVAENPELRRHFIQLLNTLSKRLSADALALRTEVTQ